MSDEVAERVSASPAVPGVPLGALSDLARVLVKAGNPPLCSFDLKTAEGRELMQKCEEEPDKPVRELVNMEFKLRHVYARVVDFHNAQTNEVYPILRICLVTTDGQVHPCASDGIRDSLLRLFMGHGEPPWDKGILVRIALKALKDSKQRLTLLEVFPKPAGGRRT